jgi:preprotein translocase subunit SecF
VTIRPSSEDRASAREWRKTVRTFLTTVMSLLSILVVLLGAMEKDALWLWIGFGCCLVSGVFVQLFISRIKNDIASGRR